MSFFNCEKQNITKNGLSILDMYILFVFNEEKKLKFETPWVYLEMEAHIYDKSSLI